MSLGPSDFLLELAIKFHLLVIDTIVFLIAFMAFVEIACYTACWGLRRLSEIDDALRKFQTSHRRGRHGNGRKNDQ